MNINFISKCAVTKQSQKLFLYKAIYLYKNPDYILKRFASDFNPWVQSSTNLTSYNENLKNVKKSSYLLRNNKLCLSDVTARRYCSNDGPPLKKLPPLMKFPEIVWPSLLKSLRNFILTNFIIKPYFDKDFNLPDFILGTKKAVEVVSSKLSEGDINALGGLVAVEVIPELQKTISQMSLSQRQQISIDKNDMYFSFPYQIGIMFDDEENKPQKRFVEITMVYHVLRGLDAMKSKGEDLPLNVGMLPQYRDSISICNYRFIKEFTKGSESDWTINLLNHFKPSDYIDQ